MLWGILLIFSRSGSWLFFTVSHDVNTRKTDVARSTGNTFTVFISNQDSNSKLIGTLENNIVTGLDINTLNERSIYQVRHDNGILKINDTKASDP